MTTKRKHWRLPRLMITGLALLAGIAALSFQMQPRATAEPPSGQWLAVQPSNLEHRIGLVGRIEPARTISISAPFGGNIANNFVEPGQRVIKGERLLSMDASELEVQVRDALSTLLKARRTVRELQDWEAGQEVSRARRALRSVQMGLDGNEQKLKDTRSLHERGIVARNELEELERQTQLQRLDLQAAEAELQAVLERGRGEYRQIAEMELANAEVKHSALSRQLASGDILAPFSGIVVQAPGISAEEAAKGPVQTGSRVSQGQPLFGLASIEGLRVIARVAELDVNQLKEGQPVDVTGDGFDGQHLQGKVMVVGGQALGGSVPGGSSQFEVVVSIPELDEAQMRQVRLGMSAKLSILTYHNPDALVVPSAAMRRAGDKWLLDYRSAPEHPVSVVEVEAGRSMPDGLEVFGLEPGYVRVAN
ncbi:efflux RND transporter periplasmic adaptor subunit [Ectopseudomonas chengduensis]|nr:efflux RND transporter periplasmic adaptor subunit [Pseudomonas chengduensis]WKC35553.1 efflux RND transporter periplasmic adaptor subunit [Pseudomonas chengduensis]